MDDIEINDHEEAKLLGRGLRKKPPRGVFLTYTQLVLLVVSLVIVYPTLLGLLWISGPVDQICSERTSQWCKSDPSSTSDHATGRRQAFRNSNPT